MLYILIAARSSLFIQLVWKWWLRSKTVSMCCIWRRRIG